MARADASTVDAESSEGDNILCVGKTDESFCVRNDRALGIRTRRAGWRREAPGANGLSTDGVDVVL